MKVLSGILDSMTNVTYRTTWAEAQQLLLDNPQFAEDAELLSNFFFTLSCFNELFEPFLILSSVLTINFNIEW